jgi:hypothetical protein
LATEATQTTLRLPGELHRAVMEAAEADGESLTGVVRLALERYLAVRDVERSEAAAVGALRRYVEAMATAGETDRRIQAALSRVIGLAWDGTPVVPVGRP